MNFKQSIRNRMDSHRTRRDTALYRGVNVETLREEILDTGIIRTTECDIIRGAIDGDPMGPPVPQRGDKLTDLNWAGDQFTVESDATAVVGGMTDRIGMTKRFRSTWELVVVFNASLTRFEPIEYSREWMNNHPGALCHVLTTADAEVRLESEGLYGIAEHQPDVGGGRTWRVEHWGSLPATSEKSRFANENEWVSFNPLERIGDAVGGIVSLMSERSVGLTYRRITDGEEIPDARDVAPEVYGALMEKLNRPQERVVLVVPKDNGSKVDEMWPVSQIAFGYDKSGFLAPEDIPPSFRGVQP